MTIEFVCQLLVVAKGRPRLGRGGHVITPKRTREFEQAFALLASIHMPRKPLEGPLRVELRFGIPGKHEPSSPCVARSDVDNYAKAVLDALNGMAYVDDRQVFDLRAMTLWAEHPSIYVRIEEVGT